ncbi:MAG: ABC transporter substrate-binding protein [Lachnospiraceae bacterium]|jgi:oligogalacturonide transport system substrate-binding protein
MKKLLSGILMTAAALSMAVTPVMAEETTEEAGDTVDLSSLGDITLRFAWWGGDARNEATMEVIDQFMELYPNITIEGEYGSSDGYHDKLATQLASGTAADIVQVDPETFPTYISVNPDYFVNLDDYDIDMSDFSEEYIHQSINGYYDGKQLGLPTGIAGPAILVNQDLADEIGIDMSKEDITWEDWIEYGKKVHEYDDSLYLFCTNKEMIQQVLVNTYCKQLIGGTIFQDGKLALTEEQLTEVLTYV